MSKLKIDGCGDPIVDPSPGSGYGEYYGSLNGDGNGNGDTWDLESGGGGYTNGVGDGYGYGYDIYNQYNDDKGDGPNDDYEGDVSYF